MSWWRDVLRPFTRMSGSMNELRLTSNATVTAVDLAMMRRALELARSAADSDEVPVGAVVYRGSEIIAEAANCREATNDPVGHAELLALSRAGQRLQEWRLVDCSMAVTLEPCPMCAGALVNARLGRLVYGATDPKAGACHTLFRIPTDRRLNHAVDVTGRVMEAECAEILKSFFRRRRADNRARRSA
jgi:tRNA(adenine34) deaminase